MIKVVYCFPFVNQKLYPKDRICIIPVVFKCRIRKVCGINRKKTLQLSIFLLVRKFIP